MDDEDSDPHYSDASDRGGTPEGEWSADESASTIADRIRAQAQRDRTLGATGRTDPYGKTLNI
jgi:hypothetical protein